MDKVGGDVNHEADSSQGASTLNPAAEVVGKSKGFDGDAVD